MKRTALAAPAVACALCAALALSLALPCAALPLGLRLAARSAAATQRAETEEERAYRIYAPDTAFEIDLSLIGTNTITWAVGQRGVGTNAVKLDWGDGTVVTNASAAYWGTAYTHTYSEIGKYILRVSPVSMVLESGTTFRPAITRILRFADSGTSGVKAMPLFNGCTNLTAFSDGTLARWPSGYSKIDNVYNACTSLAATRIPEWPDGVTSIGAVFSGCTSLAATRIPDWPDGVTSIGAVYYMCKGITATEFPEWPASAKTIGTIYGGTYNNCTGITATRIPDWPDGILTVCAVYANCTNIKGNVPRWSDGVDIPKNVYNQGVFNNCLGLTGDIPAWGKNISNASYCYANCKNLTGAWTDDPAELMPTNITSHSSVVSGTADSLRALFYSDWGGTRTKEE